MAIAAKRSPRNYRLALFVLGEVLCAVLALAVPWPKPVPASSFGMHPDILVPAIAGTALGGWLAFRLTDSMASLLARTTARALLTVVLSLLVASVAFGAMMPVISIFAFAFGAMAFGIQAVVLSLVWSLAHSLTIERAYLSALKPQTE